MFLLKSNKTMRIFNFWGNYLVALKLMHQLVEAHTF